MKVLVTGATGVLGRRVLPLLHAEGHEVTAVARSRPDAVRAAGARPVQLDLFDARAVTAAVDGQDAVLDLATRIPETRRMALPWAWRDNDRLRRHAAHVVAGAVARVGARYVRESIGLLYADGGDRWIGEDHPLHPLPHTRSAQDAEAAAAAVTAAGGTGVALRFALFYGADSGQTRDLLAAARGGTATVLGPPEAFQSQVHLDDAATAVVAALGAPAGTYNVVEDTPLRHRELVALLEELAGRSLRTPPAFVGRLGPARAMARSLRMSNAALRSATGWAPVHGDARAGLAQVAATIRETADA